MFLLYNHETKIGIRKVTLVSRVIVLDFILVHSQISYYHKHETKTCLLSVNRWICLYDSSFVLVYRNAIKMCINSFMRNAYFVRYICNMLFCHFHQHSDLHDPVSECASANIVLGPFFYCTRLNTCWKVFTHTWRHHNHKLQ